MWIRMIFVITMLLVLVTMVAYMANASTIVPRYQNGYPVTVCVPNDTSVGCTGVAGSSYWSLSGSLLSPTNPSYVIALGDKTNSNLGQGTIDFFSGADAYDGQIFIDAYDNINLSASPPTNINANSGIPASTIVNGRQWSIGNGFDMTNSNYGDWNLGTGYEHTQDTLWYQQGIDVNGQYSANTPLDLMIWANNSGQYGQGDYPVTHIIFGDNSGEENNGEQVWLQEIWDRDTGNRDSLVQYVLGTDPEGNAGSVFSYYSFYGSDEYGCSPLGNCGGNAIFSADWFSPPQNNVQPYNGIHMDDGSTLSDLRIYARGFTPYGYTFNPGNIWLDANGNVETDYTILDDGSGDMGASSGYWSILANGEIDFDNGGITSDGSGDLTTTGSVKVESGAHTVYYCSAGVNAGVLCRGNGCSCIGGTETATGLIL